MLLGHIRDAINDIDEYTSVGREAFMAERMRQDAVIRKLEIIGAAVKQLSNTTKERCREIREGQPLARVFRLPLEHAS